VTVLVALLVVGGIGGGIALAQDNENESQPGAQWAGNFEKVCEIYEGKTGVAIEPERLREAFEEARGEMQANRPERCQPPMARQMEGMMAGPMIGHFGISRNLLKGLDVDEETLEAIQEEIKAIFDEVQSDIESGDLDKSEARAAITDRIMAVLESYGIDTEALEAQMGECEEALNGDGPCGKRFIFRGHGMIGGGKMFGGGGQIARQSN